MKELYEALLAAHNEMPVIENNAINPHFRSNYTTLDKVISICRPVFAKHGFAVYEYSTTTTGPMQGIILHHVPSGDELDSTIPLRCASEGNPQQLKSAQTYARRMLWLTAAGVCPVDEDDDGQQASTKPQQGKVGLPMETIDAFGDQGELVLKYLISIGSVPAGGGFEDVSQYRDKIIADPAKVVKAAQEAKQ